MDVNQGQNSAPDIPKTFGLLLRVVNWGLIQLMKGNLSDAENSNFTLT